MDILFLGTSGHGVTSTRNLPGLLIDGQILVDCGEGTLKTLISKGIDYTNIVAIFLTHLHADHCLGLVALLWNLGIYQDDCDFSIKRASPTIYLPEGMKSHLFQILDGSFSPLGRVNYALNIVELPMECAAPIELIAEKRKYKVVWHPTAHSPACYAYKFNEILVVSGDTSPFLEMKAFIHGVNVLIHEATFPDNACELAHSLNHSTPADVVALVEGTSVELILLTHLPVLHSKEEELRFIISAKKSKARFVVAFDLLKMNCP